MNEENKHTELGLTDKNVLMMYEYMLKARMIDERMWLLNRAGKIPFVVSCQGQEGTQVGAAFALDPERDYLLPYYRDLGMVLFFGMTTKDLMLSAYAKAEDPNSGGRQMPSHFGYKAKRIVTGSSPVTTQVPHAAGMTLAAKIKGEKLVALTTFGEGSSNQGDFHEGINFASVHDLPVVFLCENNKYAISVPLSKQLKCKNVSDRAVGYGIPGVTVDGTDPLAVYEAVKTAVQRGLDGHGPTLVEAVSYRLVPHSSDDDDSVYRSREEVKMEKDRDTIVTFRRYLSEIGVLNDEIDESIRERIKIEIDEATAYAEQASFAPIDSLADYVYERSDLHNG